MSQSSDLAAEIAAARRTKAVRRPGPPCAVTQLVDRLREDDADAAQALAEWLDDDEAASAHIADFIEPRYGVSVQSIRRHRRRAVAQQHDPSRHEPNTCWCPR